MKSQSEGRSVTRWIRDLKQGDENALARLWERYFPTIKRKARAHFGNEPRVARDEEDIALSVMGTLVKQSTLADVTEREGLLRLLLVITKHKVSSEKRFQKASARGSGKVQAISVLQEVIHASVANLTTDQPSPDAIVLMSEQLQILMDVLPDNLFRQIVTMKLAGKSIERIADDLDVVPRTIYRKLKIIEVLWLETLGKNEAESHPPSRKIGQSPWKLN